LEHLLEVKYLQTEFAMRRGTVKAVNGVSYYLDRGEIVAFVGESGSGKSVTQYSSLQLIPMPPGRITSGEIIFDGKNLLDYSSNSAEMRSVRGGEIGVVFQEPMTSLNPVMTVGRQLEEGVMLHQGMNKQAARDHAVKLLKMVGISDPERRLQAYPHEFSGGMRQRIMIAIALSCNPKLLIADEATTALDVTTQAQILELMKEIVKNTGTTLVIVTHNLGIVARYAERVYVMYAGEIAESGTTREIFKTPRHPYTIGLLKAVPSLTDDRSKKLIPIAGMVTDLMNRKDQCSFLNRCPYAKEICESIPGPRLSEVSPGHFKSCFREIDIDTPLESQLDEVRRETDSQDQVNVRDIVLAVDNLSVAYPIYSGLFRKKVGEVQAVDCVSFKIFKGETLGLVGESGCGKSTIARAVMRLLKPTGGKIAFQGMDITSLSDLELQPLRRKISMIFQDPYGSLDPRQSAGDIILEPLRNYQKNLSRTELDNKLVQLMEIVGLNPDLRDRMPHEFSGGQRQRLAIARALSTDPELIVCDEAISALDVSIQSQVINLLEDLQKKMGVSYLFIAHDLSVVRHISNRVAVMYLGQLVEESTWKELYENPMHPYTKALLEAVPIPDPEIEQLKQRQIIKGEVPSPINRPSGCAFSSRCPLVTEECRRSMPDLLVKKKEHHVACFHV